MAVERRRGGGDVDVGRAGAGEPVSDPCGVNDSGAALSFLICDSSAAI